jgi:YaiO family outer membrane protein
LEESLKGRHRICTLSRFLAIGALILPTLVCAADETDLVAHARTLAYSGKQHRAEALAELKQYLQEKPDDTDARVLYGTVLSWDGQYDDAQLQLSQVLAKNPDHGDALPAMINVELWSDHLAAADQLATSTLARHPDNIEMLFVHARVLRLTNRPREAVKVLDHILALDSQNTQARQMRRALEYSTNKWESSITHSYDWFSDGRDPQHETSATLRVPTPVGSVIGTFNRADRFSLVSYQEEVDFYPHIRAGTYGNINAGFSGDGNLYPTYRAGADLFQSVGHGFEASGGYRHLGFSEGVNVYTFALAKYYGNWLFTGRGFLTPGQPGISRTGIYSARRFFGFDGLHDYVEFRYSHGASPALAQTVTDILLLNSSNFSATLDEELHGQWYLYFNGGISQEQRVGASDLQRYTVLGGIAYRF